MQQISDWLNQLGMSEYAQHFVENRIDFSVLPDLTEQHLKDLGIALGDRLKLLRAIRDIGSTPATSAKLSSSEPKAAEVAERRQVTVMFCDLVGSTALSARMDPEDLREVIASYQRCVAKVVRHFDGFVARYVGDGVLVYFGYPHAHEDDAERAVRTALELVARISELEMRPQLQARIGIATGLVVVGDVISSGEAQERGMVGETPNLAARLQAMAEAGGIVIAGSTRRLLGNLFELDDLGAKEVKGIDKPVCAWAVLRASSAASRFEALHTTGLTALVGREEELDLLLQRWSRAKAGEGQVVLLSGEPGIGKSRLTAALLERLGGEPHTRLRYFCSPQHTDSALYPILVQMQRAAGLAHDDNSQTQLDKLDALLAPTATSREEIALIAEMMSLPNDGRYPALALAPQQRRQKTLEALGSQLEALARQNPLLMIFEDAHWSDPTSLEALGRAVNRIGSLRVLLVVASRSEFEPPWIGLPHVTLVTLNRLALCDVSTMIDHIVGNKLLAPDIRRDIIERTDGIPLFVEEMTNAVLEAGNENDARRTAAAIPLPALAVPATLQASLLARLDRLGPAKEVAQIGATIGREFSHAQLAAVVRKSEPELQSALDRLIAAGLLFRQGLPPHASYLFKHALVQDVAYGTLLREPRRALHARIAETLETQFAEIAENQPELLARHCTDAGLTEKAALLWGKAGQRSLARSALVEAAAQLTRALTQIAALPSSTALRREEIKQQIGLTNALMHTKGYAAPETKVSMDRARSLIERAEALGEPPEDPLLLFSVLYGFWSASFIAFDGAAARELATQILALAEKQVAPVQRLIAHRLMGTSLLFTGDIARARAHCDQAIVLYDPVAHRPLVTTFGQDIRVAILCYRAWALWVLGYPDAALADTRQALKHAREIGHAATLMQALQFTPFVNMCCGNAAAANALADELVAVADEKGAPLWKALGMLNQGCLLTWAGRASDAVQKMIAAIAALRATGANVWLPSNLSFLARAHADVGQLDDAWRCIFAAMKAAETTGEKWFEAELHRMAGEIALSSGPDANKAEMYFQQALAIARAQQAKSWELRATMSLARLWCDQGKRDQARDLLTPVYGWFTQGFDTRDLKETKTVLDELRV
jgi:class 3 adenylate cyclase/predicted ATPase